MFTLNVFWGPEICCGLVWFSGFSFALTMAVSSGGKGLLCMQSLVVMVILFSVQCFFEYPFDSVYIICVSCYKDEFFYVFRVLFLFKGCFSLIKWCVLDVVNNFIEAVSSFF